MSAPQQPTSEPHSDAVLVELVAQLQVQLDERARQVAEQQKQLTSQRGELEYAQLKIRVLEERLRKQRIERYGKRSETLSDLQLELLDLEPGVSSEEVEAESQREPLPKENGAETSEQRPVDKPRRKHPGRNELPSHLERVEQVIACTAGQCVCGQCGKQTTVIGYEETEVLDVRPAEYFVRIIKR